MRSLPLPDLAAALDDVSQRPEHVDNGGDLGAALHCLRPKQAARRSGLGQGRLRLRRAILALNPHQLDETRQSADNLPNASSLRVESLGLEQSRKFVWIVPDLR